MKPNEFQSGPVTLDDKYLREEGRAFMTGIQALVRLPLDRKRLDRKSGLNTAGFISGYRGSPLGGYDQQLAAAKKLLDAHDVKVWEGLNEDLGATAVWGSQQTYAFPGAKFDGVFGIWYGKAPGVDRTGDVFKHANMAGTDPKGGVLALCGDDPNSKSSTLASQSEFAMIDAEMPVLAPASIQDVLDYGMIGWELSRYSGLWTSLICLADTMDSGAVVEVGLHRYATVRPTDFVLPEDGVGLRIGDTPLAKEKRLREVKLPAAQAFVRANGLDRPLLQGKSKRLGVIVSGQAARDVFEALAAMGLTPEMAADLGVSIFKVAMPWPLEPQAITRFCRGLERVLVVEHKRALVEPQLKAILYHLSDGERPIVEGKRDRDGAPLLSDIASLSTADIALALAGPPAGWAAPGQGGCVLHQGEGRAVGGRRHEPDQHPQAALLLGLSAQHLDDAAGRLARAGRHRLPLHGDVHARAAHRHAHADGRRGHAVDRPVALHRREACVREPGRRHLFATRARWRSARRFRARSTPPTRSSTTTPSR